MANAMYPKAKEAFINKLIDMTNDTIKIVIVDTAGGTNYAYSAAHEFLSDVPAGSRRATLASGLTGKTTTNGVFDAADVTNAFPSLSGGDIEAIILYQDTGVEGTSRLIAYYDVGGGLPFTPTGNNTDLVFNASGLFAL